MKDKARVACGCRDSSLASNLTAFLGQAEDDNVSNGIGIKFSSCFPLLLVLLLFLKARILSVQNIVCACVRASVCVCE